MPTKRPHPTLLVLLSRWRVNLGFAAAVVALFVAGHPTSASVLCWLPLAFVGLAIRVWARGHLDLRTSLVESGPYALVRHPLYVGSVLMGIAFTAMTNDWRVVAAFAIAFPAMYVPKAVREERYLRHVHGPIYDDYARRVAAFVPSWAALRRRGTPSRQFAWRRVLRHREYETWAGAAAACAVLWLRALWHV